MPESEQPERLYRRIADRIIAAIEDGNYKVGEKLPAERELAESLGVSRPTIREAMIALEILGAVEIRDRSGIYVVEATGVEGSGGNSAQKDLSVGAFELVEARILIEGDATGLAAESARPEDIAFLKACVASMEDPDPDICEDADRNFHIHIATMTHNGALIAAVELMWDLRKKSPLAAQIMARAHGGGWKNRVAEHEAIVRALELREPIAARQAMRQHLEGVREYLLDATETAELDALRDRLKQQRQAVLNRTKRLVS